MMHRYGYTENIDINIDIFFKNLNKKTFIYYLCKCTYTCISVHYIFNECDISKINFF